MASATIALKLTVKELDLIRNELMNRVTDYKYASHPNETTKDRQARNARRAEIEEFLRKL